jgi:hypothetical protein
VAARTPGTCEPDTPQMFETHTRGQTEGEQRENQTDAELPGTPIEAAGCGAMGCVSGSRLREVTDGSGRRRVLCPDCARRFASEGTA